MTTQWRCDYTKKEPTITMHDIERNPLKAEGKMLDSLILIMSDLKEMNLNNSNAFQKILASYWKESSQQISLLADQVKKKHPEMARRINEQKDIFNLSSEEKVETISNRFRYYPKLFQSIRKWLLANYSEDYKRRTIALSYFEKEIAPFVSYYKKKAPSLDVFYQPKRERED